MCFTEAIYTYIQLFRDFVGIMSNALDLNPVNFSSEGVDYTEIEGEL